MKATGITRKVDHLGRVVLPKEIRRGLSIEVDDPVEFYVEGDCLVIKKFDVASDVEQLLDSFESALRLKGELLPADKLNAALDKTKELKAIFSNLTD